MAPKLIFIVPYRNRDKEKIHFSVYMKYIMEDYDPADYEIYYSHQTDKRPFNRGATKNIGFLVAKDKYPNAYKEITFVFNDVDTLPSKKNMLDYNTIKGVIKHFYGFTFALGGIFSIKGEDFERCSGFPNNWGWGLEDNEIQKRVLARGFAINRYQFYHLNAKEIIHLYDSPMRLINNREPGDYLKKRLIDNLEQIRDLDYAIEDNFEGTKADFAVKNEFIINIKRFNTLINPDNEVFYSKNLFTESSNLKPNIYEKHINNRRWSLHSLINR